jgi:hypothetical protein
MSGLSSQEAQALPYNSACFVASRFPHAVVAGQTDPCGKPDVTDQFIGMMVVAISVGSSNVTIA